MAPYAAHLTCSVAEVIVYFHADIVHQRQTKALTNYLLYLTDKKVLLRTMFYCISSKVHLTLQEFINVTIFWSTRALVVGRKYCKHLSLYIHIIANFLSAVLSALGDCNRVAFQFDDAFYLCFYFSKFSLHF